MKPIRFQAAAADELASAVDYYENKSVGLGCELRAEVENATQLIRSFPQIGSPYKKTIHRLQVLRRFPYIIYYTEQTDSIWIMAIAHADQRPDYWLKRKLE